jgi:hypothetical protein
MEFKIRSNAIYSTDEDLVEDLKKVAGLLGKEYINMKEYKLH